jgi:hypothetical protein
VHFLGGSAPLPLQGVSRLLEVEAKVQVLKATEEPKWCICEGGPDVKIGEIFPCCSNSQTYRGDDGLLAGTLIQNFPLQEAKFPACFSTMR